MAEEKLLLVTYVTIFFGRYYFTENFYLVFNYSNSDSNLTQALVLMYERG